MCHIHLYRGCHVLSQSPTAGTAGVVALGITRKRCTGGQARYGDRLSGHPKATHPFRSSRVSHFVTVADCGYRRGDRLSGHPKATHPFRSSHVSHFVTVADCGYRRGDRLSGHPKATHPFRSSHVSHSPVSGLHAFLTPSASRRRARLRPPRSCASRCRGRSCSARRSGPRWQPSGRRRAV